MTEPCGTAKSTSKPSAGVGERTEGANHISSDPREIALSSSLPGRLVRRKKVLVVAAATLCVLALGGVAFGMAGFDWLSQQERADPPIGSDLPQQVGQRVVVASTDDWAVLSWFSSAKGLCLDVAFRGRSATGCGFPVAGAAAERLEPSQRKLVAGVGAVQGRGPQTIVAGVAASNVARVDLALADGRTVSTMMYNAPAELPTTLRFFVSHFEYNEPLPPPAGGGLVTEYLVFDRSGRRLDTSN